MTMKTWYIEDDFRPDNSTEEKKSYIKINPKCVCPS